MKRFDPLLYLVTDSTGLEENVFLDKIELALKNGVTMLQLREKEKSTKDYLCLANKVKKITDKYNVPFIIDDCIDIALAVKAEGVHLGADDMPIDIARKIMGEKAIIGATAKTTAAAVNACKKGADYLGVGAIYPTTTKVKTVITTVETLSEIVNAVSIPVMAIGGLNAFNLEILKGSGIKGVCVVSAIMKAEETKNAVLEIKNAVISVVSK